MEPIETIKKIDRMLEAISEYIRQALLHDYPDEIDPWELRDLLEECKRKLENWNVSDNVTIYRP